MKGGGGDVKMERERRGGGRRGEREEGQEGEEKVWLTSTCFVFLHT